MITLPLPPAEPADPKDEPPAPPVPTVIVNTVQADRVVVVVLAYPPAAPPYE